MCFPYSHNLVKVYMECDYTHLNHNSLLSQKELVNKRVIIKGAYCSYVALDTRKRH
jgi:hypothetical protein